MPKASPDEPENEPIAATPLNDLIGRQVIRSLGTPKDLLKVRVHPVGADHYRVNIVTGKDFATGKIANSFFLTADAKGKIVSSTPQIVKLY
ncbi:hypothetical protein [Singulisphaera acidiphila]|uniref:Uncharacterized protein n=1 Tax=Singulisphaera acidiphila (strain ATCC BAA-1392 / DSM 18658 / VKM B-2454 / MOB10) TaxID=886293 RepID=L0D673_SINAD|nr:hypothetical protein [Singulisphaera acidiphila]AGA24762.1 hypothetical protein Sinac_0319 [Singulisphaera acidiphila DSM 18658]